MMLLAQTDFYYANRGMGWGFDGTYVLIILAFLISHFSRNPVFPSFFLPYFLKTSGMPRKVAVENERKSCKIKLGYGELSEWSKVQHSKCCVPQGT